jgi:gliding motility-associated-like protein
LDTVSPDPQVPTPDTLTCKAPTETLDASASTTRSGSALFLWSTGDSSATTTVSSPGSYTVTVADPNNGCFADTTVDVYEADKPSIAIDSTPLTSCKGSCDGSAHISVSGGEAPYSYQWNDPSAQTSQDANSLCAGDYEVEVTDANGCVVTETATVNEPSQVQVDVSSDTTICIGGTAVLKANGSGGTPGYTYHWDQGLGTGQVQTVSPSSATSYTVYAEDANGCVSEDKTVRVELHPELQVTASPDDSICPGDVEQLTAQGSGGSGNGYSYSWSHGDFGDTTLVGPSSKTDYVVTLEDGCETPVAKDTVTVKLNKLPDVSFEGSDLNGCKPVDATFTNLTTDSLTGSDCVWDLGNGEKAASCDSIQHLYEEPGCYDVSLTVVSPEGCVDSTTKSNYVCVRPYPDASFEQEPERADVLDPKVHFRNRSAGAAIYEWDFAGLDSSNSVHPTYEFPSDGPGDYDVCLKAETNYGCRDSICRTVTIDDKALIYVPNAFNPDGDGENEYFKPVVQGIDPNEYHFYVYDRWGQVVFETHHPEGKWDGSVKGSKSSSKTDVFVWKLVTENKYTGEDIERSGHVTLIR